MLHTISNVPGGKELLTQLDLREIRPLYIIMLPDIRLVYLLQEESLHSLLISEVRKLRPGAAAPGSVGGLALLPQLPLEVRVTPPLSESEHEKIRG